MLTAVSVAIVIIACVAFAHDRRNFMAMLRGEALVAERSADGARDVTSKVKLIDLKGGTA